MKPTLRAMLVVAAGALAALGGWFLYNKLRDQAKSEPKRPKRRPHEEGPHAEDADGPAQVMPHVNAPTPDPDPLEVDSTIQAPPADTDGAYEAQDEQPHSPEEGADNADGHDLPPPVHVHDKTVDSSDGPAPQQAAPNADSAEQRSSDGEAAPSDDKLLDNEDVDQGPDADDAPEDPQGPDDTDSSGQREDEDKDEPPADDGTPGNSHGN
jgi:hypothetical protein